MIQYNLNIMITPITVESPEQRITSLYLNKCNKSTSLIVHKE
jgi:hypothetical protein